MIYRLYVTTDRRDGGVCSEVIPFYNFEEAEEIADRLTHHSDASVVVMTRVTKLYTGKKDAGTTEAVAETCNKVGDKEGSRQFKFNPESPSNS